MTFDDLHRDYEPERPPRVRDPMRAPLDREVPLGPPATTSADGLHAWLDGEASESSARRTVGVPDVELWKRLDADLARRRELRAPVGLQARIMAAIPMEAPRLVTPWWERELVLTSGNAMLAVVTMMALAAAATVLVLR